VLGVVVVLLAAILLYDHSRRDRIANGVTIDGVAVGGLSEASARTKVQRELIGPLNEPVTIRSGHRTWTLDPRHAGVVVDAQELVARAVGVSREGSIFSRTFRDLFGGTLDRDVKLHVGYSLGAVRALTAKVRAGVNRPAARRDRVAERERVGHRAVGKRPGRRTRQARRARRARARVDRQRARRLGPDACPQTGRHDGAACQQVPRVHRRRPFRIPASFLRTPETRENVRNRRRMEGLETPSGLHHVEWEQVDPPWYVPNKAWAGSLAARSSRRVRRTR